MLEEKDICCCTNDTKTLILSCAGGSNVGQVSNAIMIELDRKGIGNAYCLSGIGGDLKGFIESARLANIILIDGCQIGCGRKVLERHGIIPARYYVVTELGIEKNHNFDNIKRETETVLAKIL